jgi:hypothetical protein|uniref:Uncharacterized protein n=1 Tax=viral metagenome TaxID=1070528 RepID=A0A6C0K688_9ZZZZ
MPAPPGTMVYSILDRVIQFFQEKNNRERVQTQCLDPMIRYILDKLFPYIILVCILFSLILLMSVVSIYLLLSQLRMPVNAPIISALDIPSTNLARL